MKISVIRLFGADARHCGQIESTYSVPKGLSSKRVRPDISVSLRNDDTSIPIGVSLPFIFIEEVKSLVGRYLNLGMNTGGAYAFFVPTTEMNSF